MRWRICIFMSFLGAYGYLLFHGGGKELVLVFAACFLGTAAAYSSNNLTDKEEDLVNRKTINRFVEMKGRWFIPASFFAGGAILASMLSSESLIFYLISVAAGVSYSVFRIKRYGILKNLYSAFGASPVFLVGASAFGFLADSVPHYLLIVLICFIASLTSDLRDLVGDAEVGLRTVPVVIGEDYSKLCVLILGLLLLVTTFYFQRHTYVLSLLVPLCAFFVFRGKYHSAHSSICLSLIALPMAVLM